MVWLIALRKEIVNLRLLGLSEEAIVKKIEARANKELQDRMATSQAREFWKMVKISILRRRA